MKRIHENYRVELTATDRIQRVARLMRFRLSAFFRNHGMDITPEQWAVLLRLDLKTGISQTGLTDTSINDRPNITRILDGLEARGLIDRKPDPEDRRGKLVFMSEKSAKMADALLPDYIEEKGLYFEGLDEKDIDSLNTMLALVERNLENGPPTMGGKQ